MPESSKQPNLDSPDITTVARPGLSTTDDVVIPFTGACGIAEAATVRDRLLAALKSTEAGRVVINCDAVTEVDLTFLQILLAARASGQDTGRPVVLAAPASGVLADALVSAGLAHPDGPEQGWLNPFWSGH